jgi:hypothetical protein
LVGFGVLVGFGDAVGFGVLVGLGVAVGFAVGPGVGPAVMAGIARSSPTVLRVPPTW